MVPGSGTLTIYLITISKLPNMKPTESVNTKVLLEDGIDKYNAWAALNQGKLHPLQDYAEIRGILYNKLKECIAPVSAAYPVRNRFHKNFIPEDLLCSFNDDLTLNKCLIKEYFNVHENSRNLFLSQIRVAMDEVMGTPIYVPSFDNIINQIKNYTT